MSTLRINLGPTAGTDGSGARRANRLPALLSPAGKGPENMWLPLLRGQARGHTRATAEEKQVRLTHAETLAGLRKLADILEVKMAMYPAPAAQPARAASRATGARRPMGDDLERPILLGAGVGGERAGKGNPTGPFRSGEYLIDY